MASEDFKRKLTAVFSADVAGYSRLMGEDEAATVRTLEAYKQVMYSLIRQHQGRVVDSPGDNLLAEFASVVNAVKCGVEIQNELMARNDEMPEHRRMQFRIGVNLGDVIVDQQRIYGDGVNIAARLENLAEKGGICVSGTVFDQIEGKLGLEFDYLGKKDVKNIVRPVRVYRLKQKASGDMGVPKKADPPRSPSIAVLPFTNMSNDPEQEYFSDGITEDIITGLSKIPGLLVISRNSTFIYKGKAVKVQEVGKELGVQYVLEGSIRKAGDRVRITAQLIDAESGHHLWAERYDRNVSDIFAIQDEITVELMRAMQVKLTEGERACEWLKRGSQNIEAYEKGMKGMASFRQFSLEGNVEARKLFEDCLRLDPVYAGAYVMLGWSHLLDLWNGWSRSPADSLNQAFELAQKALSLDASQADAYALIGNVYLFRREFDKAIKDAEKAIVLNPNGADHHVWLAMILNAVGRPGEGVDCIKRALRLNPFPPSWYFSCIGDSYVMLGRHEEAVEAYNKALENSPDMYFALVGLAASYAKLGRESEARATASKILEIDPRFSVDLFAKSLPYKLESYRVQLANALRKAGLN